MSGNHKNDDLKSKYLTSHISFDGDLSVVGDSGGKRRQSEGLIAKRKIDKLYNELLHSASIFTAFTVAFDFYAAINHPNLLIFLGFVHLAQILSCIVCFCRASVIFDGFSIKFQRCFYVLILMINSAAWGGVGMAFLNAINSNAVILVIFSVAGVSLVGIYQNLIDRDVMLIWLMFIWGPSVLGLWVRESEITDSRVIENAIMTLVVVVVFIYAILKSKFYRSSFEKNVENLCLIKRLKSQKIRAEFQNKEKSMFLAAVSHDLRQPIHALGLFVGALNKGKISEGDLYILENLNKCVDSLSRAFNAMLDISKIDSGSINPEIHRIKICDVFQRLHVNFISQAECKGLQLRFKPGGRVVFSDPILIERILGNLIQNAIKHTHSGGVLVLARGHGSTIRLEVWDTGEGIRHDQIPRIFDEFYQIKRQSLNNQGAGMGLAIVKRLALSLNHRLEAKSCLGRGSMFRIFVSEQETSDVSIRKSSDAD